MAKNENKKATLPAASNPHQVGVGLLSGEQKLDKTARFVRVVQETGELKCGFIANSTLEGRVIDLKETTTKFGESHILYLAGEKSLYKLMLGGISTQRLREYFLALSDAFGFGPMEITTSVSTEFIQIPKFSKEAWVLAFAPVLIEGKPTKLKDLTGAEIEEYRSSIDTSSYSAKDLEAATTPTA